MRKMIKLFSCLASLALAVAVSPALAQTAAATPAATASAVPTPAVSVDGLVDVGYTYNFTNGSKGTVGAGNVGTFFNNQDGSYAVNLAEVDIKATQGAGTGMLSLVSGANNGNLGLNAGADILQAYVALAEGQWTFTGGRFVTWMGNEVIQSKSNWNYSRSLMFWYTIPLWHNGLSVNYTTSDSKLGITGYLVNGWNDSTTPYIAPWSNQGPTYGLQVAIKPDSVFNVILNGIAGPVGGSANVTGTTTPVYNGDTRWVGEAIIAYNPNSTWSFALDAEYGTAGTNGVTMTAGDGTTTFTSAPFFGADLYAKYQIQSDWDLALRLEELKDTYGQYGIYGAAPQAKSNDVEAREATLTIEHEFTPNLTVRLEGRMDMAYSGGTQFSTTTTPTGPFAGGEGSQFTTALGATYNF